MAQLTSTVLVFLRDLVTVQLLSRGMLWRTLRLSVRLSRCSISGSQHLTSTVNTSAGLELPYSTKQENIAPAQHARLLENGPSYKQGSTEHLIRIKGLVKSIRKQKTVAFAHITDGSALQPLQAILKADQAKEYTNLDRLGTPCTNMYQSDQRMLC